MGFLILASALSACSSSSRKAESVVAPPTILVNEYGLWITPLGQVSSVSISPDRELLVYSASQRPRHENSQIYLFNLNHKIETRFSWSDGDAVFPVINRVNQAIYFSNTDHLKNVFFEKLDGSYKAEQKNLFISDLLGENIDKQDPDYSELKETRTHSQSHFVWVMYQQQIKLWKNHDAPASLVYQSSNPLLSFVVDRDQNLIFLEQEPNQTYSLYRWSKNQKELLLRSNLPMQKVDWLIEDRTLSIISDNQYYLLNLQDLCSKKIPLPWPVSLEGVQSLQYSPSSGQYITLIKNEGRTQLLLSEAGRDDFKCAPAVPDWSAPSRE